LKADAECRNTMFNGVAQSAAKLLPALRASNVNTFRIEALDEGKDALRKKVEMYLRAISDNNAIDSIISELKLSERYGVSEGQLLSIRSYKDRVKEARN